MGRSSGGRSGGGMSGGRSSGGMSGGSRSSGGFSGGRSSGSSGSSGGRSLGGSSGGSFGSGSSGGGSLWGSSRGGKTPSPQPSPSPGRSKTPPPYRPPRKQRHVIPVPVPIIINTNYGDSGQQPPTGNPPPQNNTPTPPKKEKGERKGLRIALIILGALLLIGLINMAVGAIMGVPTGDTKITSSTVERQALPASAVNETGYYTDLDGDWILSPSKLESGMKSFFKETGVQPYLYILPNGQTTSIADLNDIAIDMYDELFTDEGHFLLVFCDDDKGSFNCGYVVGTQAKTVMDDQAIDILADYLDLYYSNMSLTEEEIFSKAFEDTGKRIMTVAKSTVVPTLICIIILAAIFVVYRLRKQRIARKLQEQHAMEEILKQPLEKFSDKELDELAKKYEGQVIPAKEVTVVYEAQPGDPMIQSAEQQQTEQQQNGSEEKTGDQ